MDHCLELMVFGEHSLGTVFSERTPTFTWAAEQHSQGKRYGLNGNYPFVEIDPPAHLDRFLPQSFLKQQRVCLHVDPTVLREWFDIPLTSYSEINEHILGAAINKIVDSFDNWAIIFELHCDQIDSVLACEGRHVIPLVRQSREDSKGVVALSDRKICRLPFWKSR